MGDRDSHLLFSDTLLAAELPDDCLEAHSILPDDDRDWPVRQKCLRAGTRRLAVNRGSRVPVD